MDWIEEKSDCFKIWLRNLSFCRAMLMYLVIVAAVTFVLSKITMSLCFRWETLIWNQYTDVVKGIDDSMDAIVIPGWEVWGSWDMWIESFNGFRPKDRIVMRMLELFRVWCPFFYAFAGMAAAVLHFYKKRLWRPFGILKAGAEAIRQNNLAFDLAYDSRDEMGQLCESFEEMRQEVIRNKEELWQTIEDQKNLNAAFAHDLRTPLTVLKGYADFLARYIPEGKVSEQKMTDTLALMSSHLERLERYSRTMKGIRSISEAPLEKERTDKARIEKEFKEIIFALNQIGDVKITWEGMEQNAESVTLYADRQILLEVLENLLSNAIRYAACQIEVMLRWNGEEEELLLAVRDDGPGFSEEDLQNALHPYYREPGETEEHFGIGLHICSLLCERHEGTLAIANSMHGGAIVTASFYAGLKDKTRDS